MRNKSLYPENWHDTIRPAILKRDKYQCVVCLVKHRKTYVFPKEGGHFLIPENEIEDWVSYGDKAYKIFLQVAHLDQDPTNNDYSNLRSMCPKCHLNFDREFNSLKRITKYKTIRNAGT